MRAPHEANQVLFCFRRLQSYDRIPRGVASGRIRGQPVSPENTLEPPANPLEGGARASVASVGVEADTAHPPCFEGMRQQ
jgi:hypothetical protein